MNNPGLYTIISDSYGELQRLLDKMQREIREKGYYVLSDSPNLGWRSIVNPVIRQNGSRWELLMDEPVDIRGRL